MLRRRWLAPSLLLLVVAVVAASLVVWKNASLDASQAAATNQPEPTESITAALATEREHRPVTTAIGTVVATQSITLKNELAGTVSQANLTPGRIVEPGTVLVALDVTVEQADLESFAAQAALAETLLARIQKLVEKRAVSQVDLDNARAERDVALAQVARARAIIGRKTIRAPFRARVGISDVHKGQYLAEGTQLTTLQGVDESVYVDFSVAQQVAEGLRQGLTVEISGRKAESLARAEIMAIDARVDPATRNTVVRAKLSNVGPEFSPGSSVRVAIPTAGARLAVLVPVSALRKGPEGDHVFVLKPDKDGKLRAHVRPVSAGTVLGDEVVIERGLAKGERVAAAGSFKLREAALVAVTETAPARVTAVASGS